MEQLALQVSLRAQLHCAGARLAGNQNTQRRKRLAFTRPRLPSYPRPHPGFGHHSSFRSNEPSPKKKGRPRSESCEDGLAVRRFLPNHLLNVRLRADYCQN